MKKYMKKPWLWLINALLITFCVTSCKTNTEGLKNYTVDQNNPVVAYEILVQGEQGNFVDAQEKVLTNATALGEVMTIINSTRKPPIETPNIDFSKEYVGLIALGQKNTGGYAIKIANIRNVDQEMVVYLQQPKPSKYVTMALTTPFVLFKFDKQEGVPSFIVRNDN